jgi:uncharacterized damage-inducible protein DinB
MNEVVSLAVIKKLFNYNYWARDRQMEVCSQLTHEQFLFPSKGSFSSLRDTLGHLMAVEWLWLERWRGRSPKSLLAAGQFSALSDLLDNWRTVECEMRAYLASLSEEAIASPLTYVNPRGEEWTYPLWQMMLHLLQHQSYHRGQVTTLLRQLGMQPPAVDFLVACDSGIHA